MSDIFDSITIEKPKDLFDEIAPESSGDLFDEIQQKQVPDNTPSLASRAIDALKFELSRQLAPSRPEKLIGEDISRTAAGLVGIEPSIEKMATGEPFTQTGKALESGSKLLTQTSEDLKVPDQNLPERIISGEEAPTLRKGIADILSSRSASKGNEFVPGNISGMERRAPVTEESIVEKAGKTGKVPYLDIAQRVLSEAVADNVPLSPAEAGLFALIPEMQKGATGVIPELNANLGQFFKEKLLTKTVKVPISAQDIRDFYIFGKEKLSQDAYDLLQKIPKEELVKMAKEGVGGYVDKRMPRFGQGEEVVVPKTPPVEPTVAPETKQLTRVPEEPVVETKPPVELPKTQVNETTVGLKGMDYLKKKFPVIAENLEGRELPLSQEQLHDVLLKTTTAGEEVILRGGTPQDAQVASTKAFMESTKPHFELNQAKVKASQPDIFDEVTQPVVQTPEFKASQVKAKEAAMEILKANKIDDQTVINLVDHIVADPEAFKVGYGQEFNPETQVIRGEARTAFDPSSERLQTVINLANGATNFTGRHEAFHAISNVLLDEGEQKILLDTFGDHEKAADAFAKYQSGEIPKQGLIQHVFDKIKQFLERLKNYFKEKKFTTAKDIFEAVDRGEMAGRSKYSVEPRAEFDRYYQSSKDLSPEDAAIQENGATYAKQNQEKILTDYADTHGTKISTDDFRDFLKPAGYNGENARLYHEPASALKKIYQSKLFEQAKKAGKTDVLILGGGSGAGKSTFLNSPKWNKERFGAILDTNLANYADAKAGIDSLLRQGLKPEIAFVYRDPVDSWTNGVIPRFLKEGRVVPISEHIRLHKESLGTVIKLALEYGDKINFSLAENATNQPFVETSLENLSDKLYNNYDEVRKEILNETNRLKDTQKITEAQRNALSYGGSESRFNNEAREGIGQTTNRQRLEGNPSNQRLEVAPPQYSAEEKLPELKSTSTDEGFNQGSFEPSKWEKIKQELYDRFEPIKYSKGKEIQPEFKRAGGNYTRSYVLARELNGKIRGISESILNDLNTRLKPLKNFKDRQILNKIYSLRNHIDLDKLGKTTSGVTADDAQKQLDLLRHDLGTERFNRISKVADDLADIQNNKALQILVDGKVISPEQAQILRSRYPNYLRSEIMDEIVAQDQPAFRRADNGEPLGKINKSFLKTKEGTVMKINDDVLDVVRRSLVAKVAAAQKQITIDQIAKDFGKEIGQSSYREGKTVTEVDESKIPPGYIKSSVKSSGGKIFAVRRDVAELLEGLNQKQADFITKAMSSYNRLFRLGATTFRIPFVFNNVFRDTQEALFKARSVPGQQSQMGSYVKGAFHALKESLGISDKVYNAWKEAGGAYGGAVSSIPKSLEVPYRLQSPKEKINILAQGALTLPFEAVSRLAEFSENTSRLAEWIRLEGTKLAPELRTLQSRDVTVDFEKVGDAMKRINQLIPFLNANVQGTVNSFRAFKDQPGVSSAKMSAYIILPAVLLYEWNKQFKNEDVVDPYIKSNFWHVNTGMEINQDGQKLPILLTIRKGEFSQQISYLVDALLEYANKDPNFKQKITDFTMQGFADSAVSTVVPPLVRVPIEESANRNFFTGRPIITQSIENVEPGKQFKPGTTNTARRIGEKTGVSPARIEHVATGLFPASKQLLEASDFLFKPQPEIKRDNKQVLPVQNYIPIVKTPSGFFSQAESDAREFKQKEEQKKRTGNFLFEQSYRQYLTDKSPANIRLLSKYGYQIDADSRERIIKKVNRDESMKSLPPEHKAIFNLPKKLRKKFQMEQLTK